MSNSDSIQKLLPIFIRAYHDMGRTGKMVLVERTAVYRPTKSEYGLWSFSFSFSKKRYYVHEEDQHYFDNLIYERERQYKRKKEKKDKEDNLFIKLEEVLNELRYHPQFGSNVEEIKNNFESEISKKSEDSK